MSSADSNTSEATSDLTNGSLKNETESSSYVLIPDSQDAVNGLTSVVVNGNHTEAKPEVSALNMMVR